MTRKGSVVRTHPVAYSVALFKGPTMTNKSEFNGPLRQMGYRKNLDVSPCIWVKPVANHAFVFREIDSMLMLVFRCFTTGAAEVYSSVKLNENFTIEDIGLTESCALKLFRGKAGTFAFESLEEFYKSFL